MLYPPVNWHEGLFLQPHHFQAWDRHWSERLTAGESWQNPYGYGLADIAINESALASGHFQVDTLRAKTPGGTLIELAAGQQSERRSVRPEFEHLADRLTTEAESVTKTLTVYLAVPRLRLGAANVSSSESTEEAGSRWVSELIEYPDETDSASVQPVELRRVNAKILFSTEDLAGYDPLPIARVHRGADGVSVEIDPSYIPPLLDCAAWPGLQTGVLSAASDLLLRTSERLGTALADEGSVLDGTSPLGLQRILALQAINPIASTLHAMRSTRGLHPKQVYFELCRLAGALDLFSPERYCRLPPEYDHENLSLVFEKLSSRIVGNLKLLDAKPYSQKFFHGTHTGMCVAIDSEAMTHAKGWILGVLLSDESPKWFQDRLDSGKLDWKLGSEHQIEQIFARREPGVSVAPLETVPDYLPRGQGWAYFRLDDRCDAWNDVMKTHSLAIRVRDSSVENLDRLVGSRQLVLHGDTAPVAMEFALFGIER